MVGKAKFLNKKMIATLKIRSNLIQAARQWLKQNNYIEVQGPIIIPAKGEWSGYLKTKIFEKKAHLAQGLHPYSQPLAVNLEKIYTFAPTFRVEKNSTKRHLLEYWRIEIVQQTNLETIIKVQEKLIEYICQDLSKSSKDSLSVLNRSTKDLERIQSPFEKITYEKAILKLQNNMGSTNRKYKRKKTQQHV